MTLSGNRIQAITISFETINRISTDRTKSNVGLTVAELNGMDVPHLLLIDPLRTEN